MKHILIDYENIQPKSFNDIQTKECHIWLFLGVNQQKSLPLDLVETLLRFDNKNVHIIRMQHTGKNALDFYLSFYLGKISAIDDQADVCILARDSGYDVLVEHLNSVYDGMDITRLANTDQLSLTYDLDCSIESEIKQDNQTVQYPTLDKVKVATKKALKSDNDKGKAPATTYQRAIALIKNQPTVSRPSKTSTLKNYLQSHLRDENAKGIDNLIKQMVNNKIILLSDKNKLVYTI